MKKPNRMTEKTKYLNQFHPATLLFLPLLLLFFGVNSSESANTMEPGQESESPIELEQEGWEDWKNWVEERPWDESDWDRWKAWVEYVEMKKLEAGLDDEDLEGGLEDQIEEGPFALRMESGFLYKSSDQKYYISSRQRIWIEAIDEGVGVRKIEVKVDIGEYQEYIGYRTDRFSLSGEGDHSLSFRVTDRLGNLSEPQEFRVVVDDTPPNSNLNYLVLEPQNYYIKNNVSYVPREHNIVIQSNDEGAGVRRIMYSQNGREYQNYKKGASIAVPNLGLNVLQVKAIDHVFNESSSSVYNVYVDADSPTVRVIPQFDLLNPDQGAVEIGTTTEEDSEPQSDTPLEDLGSWNWKNWKEKVIHPGQETAEYEEVLDEEDIILLLESDPNLMGGEYTSKTNRFFVRAYDIGSGVSRIHYRIDDSEEWMEYTAEGIMIANPGRHVLHVQAFDYVGNSKSYELPLIVDVVAPATKIKAEESTEAVSNKGEGELGTPLKQGQEQIQHSVE